MKAPDWRYSFASLYGFASLGVTIEQMSHAMNGLASAAALTAEHFVAFRRTVELVESCELTAIDADGHEIPIDDVRSATLTVAPVTPRTGRRRRIVVD